MSKVAVIGLGYVGLPLAVAFGKRGHDVIGFDVQTQKLEELSSGIDKMGEVSTEDLSAANIKYTSSAADISEVEFIIVAVPTPVDPHHQPDLTPLIKASESIAPHLNNGVIVMYESTVYPGVTEEVCLPILQAGGKKQNVDFKIGYSPERINPGDKLHTIDKIIKVVSGQDEETLDAAAKLYESVVDAGVHRASSIKVAEAAKVIENTQRDLNIALMNELSIIFERMDISTREVLKAAGTKWNFLNFYPGLVGGHCIGVDPYYLTHRAESLGYIPQVITAGRRINDGMSKVVAEKLVKLLIQNGSGVKGAKVLVLGTTFKEDVPDFRNSKVVDLIKELQDYHIDVSAHDPHIETGKTLPEMKLTCTDLKSNQKYDAIVMAVGHQAYQHYSLSDFELFYKKPDAKIFIDIQAKFLDAAPQEQGFEYWSL
jgi:UDP-N-acetyl-D-galactosamine dehydrogenase